MLILNEAEVNVGEDTEHMFMGYLTYFHSSGPPGVAVVIRAGVILKVKNLQLPTLNVCLVFAKFVLLAIYSGFPLHAFTPKGKLLTDKERWIPILEALR